MWHHIQQTFCAHNSFCICYMYVHCRHEIRLLTCMSQKSNIGSTNPILRPLLKSRLRNCTKKGSYTYLRFSKSLCSIPPSGVWEIHSTFLLHCDVVLLRRRVTRSSTLTLTSKSIEFSHSHQPSMYNATLMYYAPNLENCTSTMNIAAYIHLAKRLTPRLSVILSVRPPQLY